jgi:hypothetical protein
VAARRLGRRHGGGAGSPDVVRLARLNELDQLHELLLELEAERPLVRLPLRHRRDRPAPAPAGKSRSVCSTPTINAQFQTQHARSSQRARRRHPHPFTPSARVNSFALTQSSAEADSLLDARLTTHARIHLAWARKRIRTYSAPFPITHSSRFWTHLHPPSLIPHLPEFFKGPQRAEKQIVTSTPRLILHHTRYAHVQPRCKLKNQQNPGRSCTVAQA